MGLSRNCTANRSSICARLNGRKSENGMDGHMPPEGRLSSRPNTFDEPVGGGSKAADPFLAAHFLICGSGSVLSLKELNQAGSGLRGTGSELAVCHREERSDVAIHLEFQPDRHARRR